MFHFQPRLMRPSHPNAGPWTKVSTLLYNLNDVKTSDKYQPSPEKAYMHKQPFALYNGLLSHQKSLFNFTFKGEQQQRRQLSLPESQAQEWKSDVVPRDYGLFLYAAQNFPSLAEQMMFMGLAWLYDLAYDRFPEVNVDKVDWVTEKIHQNPVNQLIRLGQIKDAVQRSRMGILMNRWIDMKALDEIAFQFDVSGKYDMIGADWSHLDLRQLQGVSIDLTGANLTGSNLNRANFTDSKLDDLTAIGTDLSHARFNQTRSQNSLFYWTKLDRLKAKLANFNGTRFINCDLSNAIFLGASLQEAVLAGNRTQNQHVLDQIKTGRAHFEYTGEYYIADEDKSTSWKRAKFDWVVCNRCLFKNSDFDQTIFSDVTFDNCKFPQARFSNCTFKGNVEFVGCDFSGITDFEQLLKSKIQGNVTLTDCLGFSPLQMQKLKRMGFTINFARRLKKAS